MKIKYVLWAALFLVAVGVVAAQQPTMLSLQGRVLDSSGALVNNGNLRVTVSTSDSCEQNIIYDYTYNNLIQNGIFSTLLGNDTFLNLTYNQDYYICTYVNGEIQKNVANVNRTKFRGGQGQIQPSNITNGTFVNGNYTFMDNLTFGAGWFIKNDDSFLYRVTRAAIQFKNLLDRTANENVTGNWTFSGNVSVAGNLTATKFIGDGTGLTGVNSGDSEWEFVEWINYSTRNGNINVSNVTGANIIKIVYLIGAGGSQGIQTLNLTINNNTGNNYGYRFLELPNPGGAASEQEVQEYSENGIRLSIWNASVTNMTYGTLILTQIDNGQISIKGDVGSTFQQGYDGSESSRVYGAIFIHGTFKTSDKLSDVNFKIGTGNINGTVLIYKHRFFK